jgi:predicted MFS family arabinose efflux permease
MIFCLSGVAGSYLIGLILDKYKKYKTISILQPLMLSAIIFLTWLFNELNGIPKWLVLSVVALAGATMLSISVVSYQYVAEVTYPVDEVFGNSMMNTFNKLFSFAVVLGVSALDS